MLIVECRYNKLLILNNIFSTEYYFGFKNKLYFTPNVHIDYLIQDPEPIN